MIRKIIVFLTSVFLALISILASAATIGAWTVSNPMAVGASMLYDGSKGTVTSSVLITANASQVAKVLRGGGAGYALTFAVEQLLGAVDWVLDPANNQIVYNVPCDIGSTCPTGKYLFYGQNGGKAKTTAPTASQACDLEIAFLNNALPGRYYSKTSVTAPKNSSGYCNFRVTVDSTPPTSSDGSSTMIIIDNPNYDASKEQEKRNLPLETIAQKVIENAQNNNLDAQFAILAAATNILSEAEQDEAKAKPIEDELERNADPKCSEQNAIMNWQAGEVQKRYFQMKIDEHGLYEIRPHPHPDGYGTWQGHQSKYKDEQDTLKIDIQKAASLGCKETPKAKEWKDKPAPTKPDYAMW